MVLDSAGESVAFVVYSDLTPEEHVASHAIQNLISAAPELLAEAEETTRHYDWLVTEMESIIAFQDAWTSEMMGSRIQSLISNVRAHKLGVVPVIQKAKAFRGVQNQSQDGKVRR